MDNSVSQQPLVGDGQQGQIGGNNTYDINNFEIPQSSVKLNSKSFTINGDRYMAGTFCLVRSEVPNQPPHIVLIHKPKINNPPNYFSGICFYRPETLTIKVPNYQFKPNELIVTKKQTPFPHNRVIDKCFVYTFEHALKGEPVGAEGKLKFLVNLEYIEAKKIVKKVEDTKKFAPKENPRAFKPTMRPVNQQGFNNFKSPKKFGFEPNRPLIPQPNHAQSYIPPSKTLPKELKLKQQDRLAQSSEDTKQHYQEISKALGLIPEEIRKEFAQNSEKEVVWYPTPPLNISFKSYRRDLGPKHTLKYLKYIQAKKFNTTKSN